MDGTKDKQAIGQDGENERMLEAFAWAIGSRLVREEELRGVLSDMASASREWIN